MSFLFKDVVIIAALAAAAIALNNRELQVPLCSYRQPLQTTDVDNKFRYGSFRVASLLARSGYHVLGTLRGWP